MRPALLRGEAIVDIKTLRELRDELAALAELPGAASSIVQHPDWLIYELEKRGAAVSLHVSLVRNESNRIIGYAPFLSERRSAQVAFGKRQLTIYRGRMLRMLGAWTVAVPEQRHLVDSEIAKNLGANPGVRVIYIQETEIPNAFAIALTKVRCPFKSISANLLDQVNWTITPQESLESYLAGLGTKRRNDMPRRLRNAHKKLGAETHMRVFDSAEAVDEYCSLMNQVYAKSWHSAELPIDWELPVRRSLFAKLAQGGYLVGHLLMLADRPIAYVHGYRLDGRYLLDDTGYDAEFAALGLGSALVQLAVQDLIAKRPGELIDFGYGDNQYKRFLANQQAPCGAMYVVRGNVASICFRLIAPLRHIYRALRLARERLARKTSHEASSS